MTTPAPQYAYADGKPLRVLVCGGRNYSDQARVFAVLDDAHEQAHIGMIIHGGANGADYLAGEWARSRGGLLTREFYADWKRYGKSAGFMRNQAMLEDGQPDLVVAFPGGRGTADMVRRAEAAGVPVLLIEEEGK